MEDPFSQLPSHIPVLLCMCTCICTLIHVGTAPPVSFVASVGSSVTFNCFSQQPPPGTNIQWTRNGTALSEISPSLNITATVDNTGVYCCDVNGTIVNCGYLFSGGSYICL